MEDLKTRRKPVTYGKKYSGKKLPMYDILARESDVVAVKIDALPTQQSITASQQSTQNEDITHQASDESSTFSNSSQPEDLTRTERTGGDAEMFDPLSSDEEPQRLLPSAPILKRRKITPIGRSKQLHSGLEQNETQTSIFLHRFKQDFSSAPSIETTSASSDNRSTASRSRLKKPFRLASKARKRASSQSGVPVSRLKQNISAKDKARTISLTSSPTPPQTPLLEAHDRPRRSDSPSAQLIDQLSRSVGGGNRASKHLSAVLNQSQTSSGSRSPSQLGMKSLRLTPEKSPQQTTDWDLPAFATHTTRLTPSRSRRRLVDALDSPRKRSRSPIKHEHKPLFSSETQIGAVVHLGTASPTSSQAESKAEDVEVLHQAQDKDAAIPTSHPTGPKITYAKQRSHLSDMLPDPLTDLGVPSIAHLNEPIVATKSSIYSSFNSVKSQEDLNDDDPDGGGAFKSIHELRQAGVNHTFEMELDTIFEDIQASARSSKAGRLRGLMSLSRKLVEPSFAQQFVEMGKGQRLAACALQETDVLSSLLMCCALSILLSSCQLSLPILCQMFDPVLRAAEPVLHETKEFSQFVKMVSKDRKQNLSGALCRDIVDFRETIFASQIWEIPKPVGLSPCLIALRAIELVVCGVREQRNFTLSLPEPIFEKLIAIVAQLVEDSNFDLESPDQRLLLECTISILEYSTLSYGQFDDRYNQAADKLSILGPLLSRLQSQSIKSFKTIEQLALRLTLSMTNNNTTLCESLSETTLIPAIAYIIKKDFTEISVSADTDKELDESRLESVILALGTLINFAECGTSSRKAMEKTGHDRENFVEWLALVFNTRVGKVSEAASLEQSHVLVAFGYISILLCTLCLDDEVRGTVRGLLKNKSLLQLLLAAEEFLNYFRTVEQGGVEDETSSNFTDRFATIIQSLKNAERSVG